MIRDCSALILVIAFLGVRSTLAQHEPGSEKKNASLTDPISEKESAADRNWPQFRGVQASGVGNGHPPVEWDVESGKNIQWKRKLDGLGHSCPIAFGGRLFLTTAVSESNDEAIPTGLVGGNGESAVDSEIWRWQVASFDLDTGIEIWRRTLAAGKPVIKRHIKATHANSTPATDGKHVVACFGSEGLYCLDIDGNLLWQKDFGNLHSGPYDAPTLEWGFASSPIIHDGKVILQCDCLNTGFVAILDVADGSEIFRIKRDDVATWSTPLVITTDTGNQLVCNGYRQMAGYDLLTGDQLWTLHGGGDVPVPAPLTAHGLIYLFSGHGRSSAYAVSPAARGDLTPGRDKDDLPDGLTWWQPRGGSYIPTPIIIGDLLYTCGNRGVLSVRDARTGEPVYQERVGGQFSASAVATSDHVYFSSEDGVVSVVSTGTDYKLLATNDMQEPVFATPAIVGDRLLIRTTHHIYCIGTRTD
jgi:outer membrane protein assembly factor BamB